MIMELADETPHAYVPFLPAVKSSQPHGNVIFRLQSYNIFSFPPNFRTIIFAQEVIFSAFYCFECQSVKVKVSNSMSCTEIG